MSTDILPIFLYQETSDTAGLLILFFFCSPFKDKLEQDYRVKDTQFGISQLSDNQLEE